MKLSKLLDLTKGDVISIVGAGGKTSLMFSLSEELRHHNKVLVTTTTKIYLPNSNQYDYMHMLNVEDNKLIINQLEGTYLYGDHVNSENKVIGISPSTLEHIYKNFDYTLVEADGSKKKPLKGWSDNEPVVSDKTNKTIGVLDITVLGKKVNEDNIHRLDKFIEITNAKIGELITINHIISLISHPRGLFKNSLGKKVLFINKVESYDKKLLATNLIGIINNSDDIYLDGIILGSLFNKVYEKVYTK